MIQGGDIQTVILFSGRGLATSGNYRKFIEENGVKYSHTINPPLAGLLSMRFCLAQQ